MTAAGSDPAVLTGVGAIALIALAIQLPAIAILLSRLLQGPGRCPPLTPGVSTPDQMGQVSIVVPTLNESARIGPCLEGLRRQSYEVREILVVDSHSQDDTVDQVKGIQQTDPRFRVIFDDPLPSDWVGRPWALHTGFLHTSDQSTWVLGIDADTQPQPQLVASLVRAAEAGGFDLVSLAPRFILKTPGELLLQPALLMTLLYRFGPAGAEAESPERVMANGQCFLCRRSTLVALGGYSSARRSFCDDVTLARYAASQGAKVGFLDGANLIKVRMYEGLMETWREWGRSLDLKDAAAAGQTWGDVAFLLAVQAAPLPLAIAFGLAEVGGIRSLPVTLAVSLNTALVLIRVALNGAIASSYDLSQARSAWWFWLSPLADPAAALRILLSALQRPTRWRGRIYSD